jgi:uncharacterized membrane protein
MLPEWFAHPYVHAAVTGFASAFVVDVFVFLGSKTPGDFFGQFRFDVAAWRWLQGAVAGLLTGLGISAGT